MRSRRAVTALLMLGIAVVTAFSAAAAGSAPAEILDSAVRTSRVPAFGPIAPPTARPPSGATLVAASPAIFWLEAPIPGDPSPLRARVPATGAIVEPGKVRLLRPTRFPTPRRVGLQVGHWKTDEVPDELSSLRFQRGGSFEGVDEVRVNLDIARRVAALLRARGIAVDVLPSTIPPGYLADAFVSIHADGDESQEARGFKIAHGFYRGPHEGDLVDWLTEAYASATGLPWDDNVSADMTDYYGFAWYRYENALSPFTPAAIIEVGFLTHEDDRNVLLGRPAVVARGIADGLLRFLTAKSQSALFGQDVVVATVAPPR